MNKIGAAISTTGDSHRLGFLETCVEHWRAALPLGSVLLVTVDGSEQDAEAVRNVVGDTPVWRVGQPRDSRDSQTRLGVAANKNTGLELLVGSGCEHLFLSDDDAWPLSSKALSHHTDPDAPPHSMVNWGWHRLRRLRSISPRSEWTWPRGSVLYARRSVVEQVGGMIEEFGLGGHEHVEWSRRIHQAGMTEALYPAPSYMQHSRGMGARVFWHAEDMPQIVAGRQEPLGNLRQRRRTITSVRRPEGYWDNAERIMAEMDGNPRFVPFRASMNGRASATLVANVSNDNPAPRSQSE